MKPDRLRTVKVVFGKLWPMALFYLSSLTFGQISGTATSAGMLIKNTTNPPTVYVEMSDSDPVFSDVSVYYAPWEASAQSRFRVTPLGPESAHVHYRVGMIAGGGSGYIGASGEANNHAWIYYHADEDTEMTIAYTYDYFRLGTSPCSNLGDIRIEMREEPNTSWQILAVDGKMAKWSPYVDHYEGTLTRPLEAGKDYIIRIWVGPNAYGQLNAIGAGGYAIAEVDVQFRCFVNLQYFVRLASAWLQGGCETPDWSGGADVNHSTEVDGADLIEVADFWLRYCPENW